MKIKVSLKSKISFSLSLPFLCFFAWGMGDRGQHFLQGDVPLADHWKADDIVMGAGLAPIIYGLFPFILICGLGSIFLLLDWRRKSG